MPLQLTHLFRRLAKGWNGDVLIILSGLPGSGKTTLARNLTAADPRTVHLRLDTVEQALVDAGTETHPVGPAGYYVLRAVARDLLRQGLTVVADTVNPLPVTRDLWRTVATEAGSEFRDVEVFCSDVDLHRRRVEARVGDIPGLPLLTWEQVQGWGFTAWQGERTRIDTSTTTPAEAARLVLAPILAGGS